MCLKKKTPPTLLRKVHGNTSSGMIRRWRFTDPNPVIPPHISRTLCLSVSLESTTDKPFLCPHSLILDHHHHHPLSILHVLRGGGLLSFLLRDPPPYLSTTSALPWPGAGGPGGGEEKGILSALAVPPVHLPTNFPLHGPDLMAARGRAVNTVISKELDTDLPLNRSERPLFMSVVR